MSKQFRSFVAADYVVFALMLSMSTAIGFFFAIKDRRKQSTKEYLLAGRSMSPYPVALSLSVSFLSAVTVLGTPAEVYLYGTMYVWTLVGYFVASLITALIFIPVYYKANITSVYQYLEYRFHRGIRIIATIIYLIQTILYTGIVIFAPALALHVVTGFNLWAAAVSTGVICIVYSTLGGLKAVIWTDALQMVVMLTGFVSVIIQASVASGGFESLWRFADEGQRLQLWNFDLDPRVRHTVWSVVVGSSFLNLALYAVNQAQVQRYLSCPSASAAQKAVLLNYVGVLFLNSLALLSGVVMYGYFHNCDPLSMPATIGLDRADQLMPYMVLDLFRNAPGMPGLFIAAVYSGSLSTVSTAITAMASVTVQDYLKPNFQWTESTLTWISRGFIVFFGLICILFAYLTSKLGGILLQASISVLSLAGAPLIVVFVLGVLCPFANTWGALTGMVTALTANVWIFFGKIAYKVPEEFNNLLPLSTSNCSIVTNSTALPSLSTPTDVTTWNNSTAASTSEPYRPPVADLYAMSYIYLTAFGFCIGIVCGIFASILTGGCSSQRKIDPILIHPFFQRCTCGCLSDIQCDYCSKKVEMSQSSRSTTEV